MVNIGAGNEHLRSFKFFNHGEGPFYGHLLVESAFSFEDKALEGAFSVFVKL